MWSQGCPSSHTLLQSRAVG
uniref:Uncharacterized protein n=1 Tax=Anguilla anguilla TaxID=7936 RepID=A0A0E9SFZ7_ANGAN